MRQRRGLDGSRTADSGRPGESGEHRGPGALAEVQEEDGRSHWE